MVLPSSLEAMDTIRNLKKLSSIHVVRVLLRRPHNGIKPQELREAISHGSALGSNTRRDGLCVSFKAANFDSQLADFKALNHET